MLNITKATIITTIVFFIGACQPGDRRAYQFCTTDDQSKLSFWNDFGEYYFDDFGTNTSVCEGLDIMVSPITFSYSLNGLENGTHVCKYSSGEVELKVTILKEHLSGRPTEITIYNSTTTWLHSIRPDGRLNSISASYPDGNIVVWKPCTAGDALKYW